MNRWADQMVVMVRAGAAPVDRLAGVGPDHVDQVRRGQRLQGAIHRRQADVLAAPAEFVMQFLSRPELIDGIQKCDDRAALPRRAHAGTSPARITIGNHFQLRFHGRAGRVKGVLKA